MAQFSGNQTPYWLGTYPPNSNFTNINVSSVNGYPYPWTSTLGNVVSTYTIAGNTANVPNLLGYISFPYEGDYFITQKAAFTKVTGGVAQECHGILMTDGGGLPTFPGGNFGMSALPTIGENNKSTFTTLVSNILVSGALVKGVYYYDPTGNNYTASLISDIPVIHYNPGKI